MWGDRQATRLKANRLLQKPWDDNGTRKGPGLFNNLLSISAFGYDREPWKSPTNQLQIFKGAGKSSTGPPQVAG
ncbi:hypothetical protein MSNKSG1_11673 [Marinobacter santoriniensis NKSG1]|uniref:Uncharacterized protein n=1 Tax=Marinobacter santoriniensis NKSG1 TaxID=1288826 RepID=M7CQ58_9GAMM|nr:hypothetical protein MSNKSG1_11673 [Marinobacter santoriniensis NKSG1]